MYYVCIYIFNTMMMIIILIQISIIDNSNNSVYYYYVCIHIYIYTQTYVYTFNMIEDLWISNLHRTLGFPRPRWMHAPSRSSRPGKSGKKREVMFYTAFHPCASDVHGPGSKHPFPPRRRFRSFQSYTSKGI